MNKEKENNLPAIFHMCSFQHYLTSCIRLFRFQNFAALISSQIDSQKIFDAKREGYISSSMHVVNDGVLLLHVNVSSSVEQATLSGKQFFYAASNLKKTCLDLFVFPAMLLQKSSSRRPSYHSMVRVVHSSEMVGPEVVEPKVVEWSTAKKRAKAPVKVHYLGSPPGHLLARLFWTGYPPDRENR